MALTNPEKVRAKYHLGYTGTSTAASIQYGLSRPLQYMFVVENALGLLMEDAVGTVRDLIAKLDKTESQIFEAQERLAAEKLGEITLRADEIARLEDAYVLWANRLADILGVPKYAYATRFQGSGYGNVPVSH